MRRSAKRDANEAAIIEALRKVGCTVQQLSATDAPDLIAGRNGVTYLLEVKTPLGPKGGGSQLSDGQRLWHERWRGSPVHTVRSVEEALAVVLSKHPDAHRQPPGS